MRTGTLTLKTEGEFPFKANHERTLFHWTAGGQKTLRFHFDAACDPVKPWALMAYSRMYRRRG